MRKEIIAILLSLFFGILCASFTLLLFPQKATFLMLFAVIYNRLLIGLFIPLLSHVKLIDKYNELARGFVVGFLISYALSMPEGLYGLIFAFYGGLYGALIDYISNKFGS